MTFATVLAFLLKFGPEAAQLLPLLEKLAADIKAGRGETELSPADWAELARLNGLTASSIFAKEGVALPPPASPAP